MRLVTVFERSEITKFLCPAVVVEMWRPVMTTGMGKRKFLKAFTAEEQAVIKKMYKTYCHWCLGVSGTGIPDRHVMKIKVFQLMHRAAKFFGEFGGRDEENNWVADAGGGFYPDGHGNGFG